MADLTTPPRPTKVTSEKTSERNHHLSWGRDAVLAFDEQQARAINKQQIANRLYALTGTWVIESVWDLPEIWVPYCLSVGHVPSCEAAFYGVYRKNKLGLPAEPVLCDRPEGHSGRHAAYGEPDRTKKLFRVWAVWP